MNLLDIFFIVSGFVIFLLGIDIARKEKFNALHFFVFLGIWGWLLVFTFFPRILDTLWDLFWLQRGADVLVYFSIIFLIYFVLVLLRKIEWNKSDITRLIREIAIHNAPEHDFDPNCEVFIIPAYNEWSVIAETIQTVIDAWFTNILVINDGSNDDSRNILKMFWSKILVLSHYKNRGQWASLETWFEYMRRFQWWNGYVITFDSDGQHDIADVERFRQYKDESIDILLWSRFLSESQTNVSFKKKMVLKLGIIFTFFLSNIKLSDTHNGYRYMKLSSLNDISITIDGMGHASEIIDIIATKKLRYREVPVNIIYSEYSISKGQKISNSWNVLTRFIWTKFFK